MREWTSKQFCEEQSINKVTLDYICSKKLLNYYLAIRATKIGDKKVRIITEGNKTKRWLKGQADTKQTHHWEGAIKEAVLPHSYRRRKIILKREG